MIGQRRVHSRRPCFGRLSVIAALMLTSCPAIPFVIPTALEFARNLLITANSNYGSRYSNDVNHMLTRLTQSYMPPPPAPLGASMPGQPGQLGAVYPGQPSQ